MKSPINWIIIFGNKIKIKRHIYNQYNFNKQEYKTIG